LPASGDLDSDVSAVAVAVKAVRPEDVVRLKQLEKENARLKRLLAEKELDVDMLREVARGNW
jgi:hypothetical protein